MDRQATDLDLLRQFQAGSPAAFTQFYDFYKAGLYMYLLSVTRDEALAADGMQELFTDLCKHLERFLNADNIRHYLFSAAHRTAAMLVRRAERVKRRERHAATLRSLFAPAATTQDFPAPDYAERLSAALLNLPEEQREVIILHSYQCFTFQDMQTMTGVSLNTLYSRYKAGLATLKIALHELGA